ncbi:MAG: Ig-like domain-containing protein [Parasporobacterium sp.]|nr:Ig-like domain-containing protein [Parasporobacterium sp.]
MKRVTRRLWAIVLAFAMTVTMIPAFASAAFADEEFDETVVIIHTNDVHGHINVEPYVKGLADQMKSTGAFSLVLTVSGGDVYGGGDAVAGYYNGELIPQIQDQVYDVIVPGNNDFGTGIAGNALLTALYKNTKTICANIQVNDDTDVAAYAESYSPKIGKKDFAAMYDGVELKGDGSLDYSALNLGVISKDTSPWEPTATFTTNKGTKVGLFGLTCTGGQVGTVAHSQGTVQAAKDAVTSLKSEGADVIVGVGHVGWMGEGSLENAPGNDTNSWAVANEVQGMDALVDAHTHSIINDGEGCYVGENKVLVNQASCYGDTIGVMSIFLKDGKVVDKKSVLIYGDAIENLPSDEIVQKMVDDDYVRLSEVAGDPVAKTPYFLNGEKLSAKDIGGSIRGNETNLGDFITDIILAALEEKLDEDFDFTYLPGYYIRSSVIEESNITMIELASVIGYDNTSFSRKIYTAQEIVDLVTAGLASVYPQKENITFNQYSGLQITYINDDGTGIPVTIKVGDTLIYDANKGGIQVDDTWTAKGMYGPRASTEDPTNPDIICQDGIELRGLLYNYLATHEAGKDYVFYPDTIAPDNRIVEVKPPEPVVLDIENKTSMFKAVSASLVEEEGQEYLVMALNGTGYRELCKGTYEDALANGDGTADKGNDKWIHGYLNAEEKYEFKIPVAQGESFIPLVAISNSYYNKYLDGENPIERAYYPRQVILDREAKTLVTDDYNETSEFTVISNVADFKAASPALTTVIGGPNSNNYSVAPILGMTDTTYDKVTYQTADKGAIVEETAVLEDGKFAITLKNEPDVEAFKDKTPIEMKFHVSKDAPYAEADQDVVRTVTIDKSAKTITIDGDALGVSVTGVSVSEKLSLVYGQSETLKAVVTPEDAANKNVSWKSSNEKVAAVNPNGKVTAKGAGTATITVTTEDGGYTADCKVTVTKADVTGVTAPKAKILTYTGKAQALVTAGKCTGGTMQYSLDNKTFSAKIPTGTNAGNYTVYWKVKGDANHKDTAVKKVSVSIAKAGVSVTKKPAKKTNLTYTGKAQALITAGKCTGGTIQYKLNNGSWSTKVPTAKNAGQYTVYWRVKGDANHNNKSSVSIAASIAKAKNTVTAKAEKALLTAKAGTTIKAKDAITVSKAQGKVTYKKASGNSKITVASNGNISINKSLAKGMYTIKVQVTAAGNSNYKSGTRNVTLKIKVTK